MPKKDNSSNRERKKTRKIEANNYNIYSNRHVRIKNKLIKKITKKK